MFSVLAETDSNSAIGTHAACDVATFVCKGIDNGVGAHSATRLPFEMHNWGCNFVGALYVDAISVKWGFNSTTYFCKYVAINVKNIWPIPYSIKETDNVSGCKTVLWLTAPKCVLSLRGRFCVCKCGEADKQKKRGERVIFHTHLGFFYLASTLCSAPTLWRCRPAIQPVCFSFHPDVGKLFASPL